MKNELLNEIQGLLEQKASGRYGLSLINQQQHALQGAWLRAALSEVDPGTRIPAKCP